MNICSQYCQHPSCWQSEVEEKRRAINGIKKDEIEYVNCNRNTKPKKIPDDLPTWKVLNLFEAHCNKYEDLEDTSPKRVQSDVCLPIQRNVSLNFPSSDDDDSNRQIVRNKKYEPIGKPKVSYNIFDFSNNIFCEEQKFMKWIPGKKVMTLDPVSSEKKVFIKTIDGEVLPNDIVARSQAKSRNHSLPSLKGKQKDKYQHVIDTYGLFADANHITFGEYCSNSIQSNIEMPSPLRTNRVQFYDYPTISYFKENIKKAEEKQLLEKPVSPSQPKLLYIKDGRLLSRSPSFLHKPKSIKRRKDVLMLTKVSVPKKAIRKYPIFHHCKSSIKQKKLSDVQIQPLSHSENNSSCSSQMSLRSATSMKFKASGEKISSKNNFEQESPPECTYNLISHLPSANSSLPCINCGVSRLNDMPHFEHCQILETSSSNFLLLKPSQVTDSELLLRLKRNSSANSARKNVSFHGSYSDCSSPVSFDFDPANTEIIEQTYHKYESFSPFKTPQTSKLQLEPKSEADFENSVVKNISKRTVLNESKKDMSQYLPESDHNMQPKNSFVTRSLSPSLSMFARQQKQPPANAVPHEMKISQVQLNPLPTRTFPSIDLVKQKNNKVKSHGGSFTAEPTTDSIQAPPPTPNVVNDLTPSASCEHIIEKSSVRQPKEILVHLGQLYPGNAELNVSNCSLDVDKVSTEAVLNNKEIEKAKESCDSINSVELEKVYKDVTQASVRTSLNHENGSGNESNCIHQLLTNNTLDQASQSLELTQIEKMVSTYLNTPSNESIDSISDITSNKFNNNNLGTPANESINGKVNTGFSHSRDDSLVITRYNSITNNVTDDNENNDCIDEELKENNNENVIEENDTKEESLSASSSFDDLHNEAFDPLSYHDFTDGVNFNLQLDEEIMRAMQGEDVDIDDYLNVNDTT